MSEIHDERRDPETPRNPVDLAASGTELLGKAGEMSSGRSARTLTPGMHAPLKQTLIALRSGVELSEHETNGPATIYLLQGAATIAAGGERLELRSGEWSMIPDERHSLHASEDTVALLTVALDTRA